MKILERIQRNGKKNNNEIKAFLLNFLVLLYNSHFQGICYFNKRLQRLSKYGFLVC